MSFPWVPEWWTRLLLAVVAGGGGGVVAVAVVLVLWHRWRVSAKGRQRVRQ